MNFPQGPYATAAAFASAMSLKYGAPYAFCLQVANADMFPLSDAEQACALYTKQDVLGQEISGAGGALKRGYLASAQKVIASARAARPAAVMGSPPTFTEGVNLANSTIITSATAAFGGVTPNGSRYEFTDTRYIEQVAGKFGTNSGVTGYTGQGQSANNTVGDASKTTTWGNGFRFCTRSQKLDFSIQSPVSGAIKSFILYMTDMRTGVRQRCAANDYSQTTANATYMLFDFGSAFDKIIEIYVPNTAIIRSLNVPLTETVWRLPQSTDLKVAFVWDSYGFGALSDGTNNLKLNVLGEVGEVLGTPNLLSFSRSGTGYLNPAGAFGTYRQRLQKGDLDFANVGIMDVVAIFGSINDSATVNAAYTDAALVAEILLTIPLIMVAQPTAIIYGTGPQVTLSASGAANQARCDAMRDAFLQAGGGDPRVRWIDSSPNGQNWEYATPDSLVAITTGSDNTHRNDVGKYYDGDRIAGAIIADCKSLVET
jgi:hypothetical protein